MAALVIALAIGRNVRRARLGRNLMAVRDNETQAMALGIRLTGNKLTAFALSGFLAALAGGLYTYNVQALSLGRFEPEISLLMFAMVVIGGMGSMTGALLGAMYVRGIQYFLSAQLQLFATGAGLLILLLVFPGGLGQIFFELRDRYLRWVAGRRNLIVPSLVADRLADEGVGAEVVLAAERGSRAPVEAGLAGTRGES
jgi:branched-chain amino acid transport system permease protein